MDTVAVAKEVEAIPGFSNMAIPFPRVVQLLPVLNDWHDNCEGQHYSSVWSFTHLIGRSLTWGQVDYIRQTAFNCLKIGVKKF